MGSNSQGFKPREDPVIPGARDVPALMESACMSSDVLVSYGEEEGRH